MGFALQIIARRVIVIESEASRQGDEKEWEGNAEEGDDNEGHDGTNQNSCGSWGQFGPVQFSSG